MRKEWLEESQPRACLVKEAREGHVSYSFSEHLLWGCPPLPLLLLWLSSAAVDSLLECFLPSLGKVTKKGNTNIPWDDGGIHTGS